ncbi:MAG: peptidoglycan-binding protein [Bryobacteraceae bacterium]|nr:peptidoglycan-binding protein [Solibacteraceae bacterium]MCL4797182.1 peptidoglycan-binding protein [Bryobacteraceae bacterium]MCO5353952.1 peptidoglycan-binding protein [Bryobacteraceae bacterium]
MTLKPARLLVLALAASLALFPQTAKKSTSKAPAKAAAKKTAPKKSAARKSTPRKATAKKATSARQVNPDRDRIVEIQQALTERGYPVEPTGTWGPQSVAALKQFQEEHDIKNLSGRGKLDPLTLIALGLGPKHEPPAPAVPTPPESPEPPAVPTPNQEGQNP